MPTKSFPYGNAFLVSTPAIDRVGAMMINDQRARDVAQQRDTQILDQEMSKNMSAMRDVDIPKLTKMWGEYKALAQDLYKNGNKLSNEERIAKTLEKQRMLGGIYSHVNKSKTEKEPEDLGYKSYMKNPDKFEDTTPQFIVARRNTPVDELEAYGVQDVPNNILLKTTDFSKDIAEAMGGKEPKKRGVIEEVSEDKLTTTPTEIKGYNSPHEYSSILTTKVFSNKNQKRLPNQFPYDDQKANEIIQRYNELVKTPAFQAAYPNEPEFTQEEFATPTGRTISLMSMEHALLHPPVAIKGKPYNNTSAIREANNKEWERRAGISLDNAIYKMGIQQQYKRENIKSMLAGAKIDDVYGKAAQNEIELPTEESSFGATDIYPKIKKGTETLVSLEGLTPPELSDLGVYNNGSTPSMYRPVYREGKPYLRKDKATGLLLDAKGTLIDADNVFIKTRARKGTTATQLKSGKIKKDEVPAKNKQPTPLKGNIR